LAPIAEPASDKVAQEPGLSLKRRRARREPEGLDEASRPANKRSGFADAASALIVLGTALFFVFAGNDRLGLEGDRFGRSTADPTSSRKSGNKFITKTKVANRLGINKVFWFV
jgi:hypothetical protein